MFTLFWGGNVFAPRLRVDGESAQDWLQTRYIEALAHCRRRLKNCKALAGWVPINRPNPGLIGKDLKALGLFGPGGAPLPRIFGEIPRTDYFSLYQGRPVNFAEDFLEPFTAKLLERTGADRK
jgi:hypothetical protein